MNQELQIRLLRNCRRRMNAWKIVLLLPSLLPCLWRINASMMRFITVIRHHHHSHPFNITVTQSSSSQSSDDCETRSWILSYAATSMIMIDSGDGGGRIAVAVVHRPQTILTPSTYSLMSFMWYAFRKCIALDLALDLEEASSPKGIALANCARKQIEALLREQEGPDLVTSLHFWTCMTKRALKTNSGSSRSRVGGTIAFWFRCGCFWFWCGSFWFRVYTTSIFSFILRKMGFEKDFLTFFKNQYRIQWSNPNLLERWTHFRPGAVHTLKWCSQLFWLSTSSTLTLDSSETVRTCITPLGLHARIDPFHSFSR